MYAIVCDRDAIQMRDVCFQVDNQYIGSSISWNVWLHHWQHQYISMFGNMVAIGKKKVNS